MNTDLFPLPLAHRATMNGKPVHEVPAKSVINFASAFSHKLLCDGLTFSTGSACVYSCAFCYVPDLMRKSPHLAGITSSHEDIVIRRRGAIEAMRQQLTDRHGRPKFSDPADRRVIFASPLVDVAGNMDLVQETIEACRVILALTTWDIRLLSKSNLLPKIAHGLRNSASLSGRPASERVIYGVSTGTLDDKLARAFEAGTPLVSKRIASLHWLQDEGFRTYGMICPSLPQRDYTSFAQEAWSSIRADKCEHVWTEVINARGDSFTRTCQALRSAGYDWEAAQLERNAASTDEWEEYARATFEAHVAADRSTADFGNRPPKLRQLQYVTKESRPWWKAREEQGAVLL